LSAVDRNELRKVPYIDHVPLDDRMVFLQPYLDEKDNTFKTFVPQGNKLTWIFAEPVESCYYAEVVIDESKDVYLRLIDVIARHYSFDSVINTLLGIIRDIENCSIVVEKYFVFLGLYRNTKNVLISNLITTDLEYLFGNVRSLYDLLQSLIRDLWRRTSNKILPNNFSRMIREKPENLRRKYDLPEPLVEYYVGTKDFFVKCREIRNSIYHRGLDIQIVFCTEDGFALQKNPLTPNPITSKFDIWPEEKTKKNGLVSVLALISFINKRILEDTDAFSQALIRSIQPPPSISESHRLFFRGPYIHHLLKSEEYLEKQWV
jgi:hypothetical protein